MSSSRAPRRWPPGPYSYPPATSPFLLRPYLPYPPPAAYANPNPNPNPNPAAWLMQLLAPAAAHLDPASFREPASSSSDFSAVPLPSMPSTPSARMSSSKAPRGRLLGAGDRAVHDVDSRLHPGEARPPQLEFTPITKYTSDPGLVLGRQIAVNRSYIVYGLKLGNIRVLDINTALRSLLRGHSQFGKKSAAPPPAPGDGEVAGAADHGVRPEKLDGGANRQGEEGEEEVHGVLARLDEQHAMRLVVHQQLQAQRRGTAALVAILEWTGLKA